MAKSGWRRRVEAERAAAREGERLSEYFNPDRGQRPVLRFELQALLVQLERARTSRSLWRRVWKYLMGKVGSDPSERGGT